MVSVGIRELKNRLSEYLSQVRAGETITVTDRGTPIATVSPIEAAPDVELSPSARRLIRDRAIKYKGPFRFVPNPVSLRPGDQSFSDMISEDRGSTCND